MYADNGLGKTKKCLSKSNPSCPGFNKGHPYDIDDIEDSINKQYGKIRNNVIHMCNGLVWIYIIGDLCLFYLNQELNLLV